MTNPVEFWKTEFAYAMKRAEAAEARLAAVEALCDEARTWTGYNSRDCGPVFAGDTVTDFITEVRAIARGQGMEKSPLDNYEGGYRRGYEHGLAARGEGDRPAEAVRYVSVDEPHPYETAWKSPPGSEAGCTKPGRWGNCGAPRSAPVHSGEGDRSAEDWASKTNRESLAAVTQMMADAQREHAAEWAAENRPNLGPVSGEGDRG